MDDGVITEAMKIKLKVVSVSLHILVAFLLNYCYSISLFG